MEACAGAVSQPCAGAASEISGKRLGPAVLGRRRRAQRRAIGLEWSSSQRGYDVYCEGKADRLRVAYAPARLSRSRHDRAVLILTSNRLVSADGVAPGATEDSLRQALSDERRLRVGRTTWYLGRRGPARVIYRVTRGRVAEVGIADRRFVRTARAARRMLRMWSL